MNMIPSPFPDGRKDVSDHDASQPCPMADRRRAVRLMLIRPAKLFDPRADKYFPGRTTNLSDTGVLLTVNRSMPIHTGDELSVGLSRDEFPSVLTSRDFRPSRVVRVIPIDQHAQAVALEFISPDSATESSPHIHVVSAGRGKPARVAA